MPIILYDNIAFVVSKSEFLTEYKKLETKQASILERISSGYDFDLAVTAITELYTKGKEMHKDDLQSQLYSFNYSEGDAQGIVMELLVLFSALYHKSRIKICDTSGVHHFIRDYLLPHQVFHYWEDRKILIADRDFNFSFQIKEIKQIRGVLNNFVIHFNHLLLHFCFDAFHGKYIKIVEHNYDFFRMNKNIGYEICDFDYVFDRARPSKRFLWKYRREGFLVVLD